MPGYIHNIWAAVAVLGWTGCIGSGWAAVAVLAVNLAADVRAALRGSGWQLFEGKTIGGVCELQRAALLQVAAYWTD